MKFTPQAYQLKSTSKENQMDYLVELSSFVFGLLTATYSAIMILKHFKGAYKRRNKDTIPENKL